jgi:hypothetical protein
MSTTLCLMFSMGVVLSAAPKPEIARQKLLPPGPDNPRNSEGDFIELRDGRMLFLVYAA